MTARLAYVAQKVSVVDSVVYRYRVNPHSLTQSYKEKHAQDLFEISDRIKSYYETKSDYEKYRAALKRGRARIKTITLLQLAPDCARKYTNVFPDLKDSKDLPILLRLKLRAMEHNNRFAYKLIHKIESFLK